MPRILLDAEPFTAEPAVSLWERGRWPAHWIGATRFAQLDPQVLGWRLRFELSAGARIRLHVSADERYELFLDGHRLGRGPERGDLDHWFFESYDEDLAAGSHTLVARTWWLGPDSPGPFAQISRRPAFLLATEGVPAQLLNTGLAAWEVKRLGGYAWMPHGVTWGAGVKVGIDGAHFPWGFERGEGEGWLPAVPLGITRAGSGQRFADGALGWFLRPAVLPAMREEPVALGIVRHVEAIDSIQTATLGIAAGSHRSAEAAHWQAMIRGEADVRIPARTRRRVLIDCQTYVTAFLRLVLSGGTGSQVRIHWAEALFELPQGGYGPKGHRDRIEGKFFNGPGEWFRAEGGSHRVYETLWWEAGRYLEVLVETADEDLVVEAVQLRATHYPWKWTGSFESSDARLAQAIPLMIRTLEACSHETYMDCPYYEQLMYVGDTRLEILASYVMSADVRLPRKAIALFDWSRETGGLTQSRYPCFAKQVIPPFSLWWVGMVRDWLFWRDEPSFARECLEGVRAVIEVFHRSRDARGLVCGPEGWNYVDWVPSFPVGLPPDGDIGQASAIINWHYALALRWWIELEEVVGDPEMVALGLRRGEQLAMAIDAAFWNTERGMYADQGTQTSYSEHAQCMALLSGFAPVSRRQPMADGLLSATDLARTTIYFNHYLFETYQLLGRTDRLIERMDLWFSLSSQGLFTTLESPEPSRSDCHAWGAHPLYHYAASILGIRPASSGFNTVLVQPNLGPLAWARGKVPHPRGVIAAELRQHEGRLIGWIDLPPGLTGTFRLPARDQELGPGRNDIR